MKTKTLLLLACLASLTSAARAEPALPDNDLLVLPTYVVKAPRYSAVENRINASLEELRRQAKTPVAIPADNPARNGPAARPSLVAHRAPTETPGRVAKS